MYYIVYDFCISSACKDYYTSALLRLISYLINAADELTIYSQGLVKDVPLLRTGIAWPSDKEVKFRNPTLSTGQTLKEGN